jgi:signal transduction histidine kinase
MAAKQLTVELRRARMPPDHRRSRNPLDPMGDQQYSWTRRWSSNMEDEVPYHSIQDPATLRRVLEAVLLIEADIDLPILLHHIVDEARSMANARYGALGVLNDDGTALDQFITVGLEPEVEARIGARPTGEGVLGLLISDPKPLRLARIDAHGDSYGFPPGHPHMTSFLGVPIRIRDEVYGNLYLTDKVGWSEFTGDDEALVGALALAAGIAIDNARLHQRAQEMVVYEERDRLARDLHDTVIQRLFAVGLSLQSIAGSPSGSGVAGRLETAIVDIDDTIRQVRTSIFELGLAGDSRGVRADIVSLVAELTPVVGFDVTVAFDGPIDSAIPSRIVEHLLATVREAVSNVGRHAQARKASVNLMVTDGMCRLEVIDDGRGYDGRTPSVGGLGLGNMRSRAEKFRGTFAIEGWPDGGTSLTWQVPLSA